MKDSFKVNPQRCPLCGGPNACAMALPEAERPSGPCWCTREQFSAQLLQQVPDTLKNKACICQACVVASRQADPGAC